MASQFRKILTLLCAFSTGPAICSQQNTAPAKPDPRALVIGALDRLDASESSATQYTNWLYRHTLNYSADGTKTFDLAQLFEATWINHLPYHRLVEVNGKPLDGKTLQEEQARFDRAVSQRLPLGNLERVLLVGAHPVRTGANPHDVLRPGYVLKELWQDDSPQGRLHVIEATATQPSTTGCDWHFRLWISEKDPTLFHYYADVPEDKNASEVCSGSTDEGFFDLINGSPRVVHTHSHLYTATRGLIESDDVYSRYRRFQTTITISAAPDQPPSSDAPSSRPLTLR